MGLIPGAFPSDQASRQTLNITAMRFPFGHRHVGFFIAFAPDNTPIFARPVVYLLY
jgi:hypothetical protein